MQNLPIMLTTFPGWFFFHIEGEEDESRYTGPNALQLLKALPTKLLSPPHMMCLMKQVLSDLLNALTAHNEPPPSVEGNN